MRDLLPWFMRKEDDEFSVTFKKKHAVLGIVVALLLIGQEGRALIAKILAGFFP